MRNPTLEPAASGHGRPAAVPSTPVRQPARWLLGRWPTLAGIALAAFSAAGMSSGAEHAPVLAASGLVYLAAAALGKPTTAWPVFLATFVVIGAAKATDAFDGTWALLVLAVVSAGYGLFRGAVRPTHGLPLQTAAMLALGITTAVALLVNADLGGYLIAAGLLGHAAWDVWHHRTNRVVVRSLAEFCVVLDTLLAIAILIVTLRG